jgi:sugar lactone lactonase YvrE
MAGASWTIAAQTHDRLGESPMWHPDHNALYWIDWYGPTLHRRIWGQDELRSWTIPDTSMIGSFVFASGGRLMLAVDSGLVLFDPETGTTSAFADPNGGRENVLYNDSKLDRFGRLWVGTFEVTETEPRGILHCVEADGSSSIGDSGFAVCNGPAFSPDGETMYFSDSAGRRILAYDVSRISRALKRRRVFAQFGDGEGLPDGLTVDAEGAVWCAHYGSGRVSRFAPDGRVLQSITLPCPVVTAPAFGGPDLTTLFVTTGWSPGVTRAADEPGPGGGVLALETGIRGLAEPIFAI